MSNTSTDTLGLPDPKGLVQPLQALAFLLPFIAADILALLSSVHTVDILAFLFSVHAVDNFTLVSSESWLPNFAADILAFVFSDVLLPNFAADHMAFFSSVHDASSWAFLFGVHAADILTLASSECLVPEREPAIFKILYSGFNESK